MSKTRSTEEASTPGPTEERMTETGWMVNSTEMANTTTLTLVKPNAADGKTESALSGTLIDSTQILANVPLRYLL